MAYRTVLNTQSKAIAGKPSKARKERRVTSGNIGEIIHDFRSSLNVIIGYSELMLDNAMGEVSTRQRDSLKDILSSGENLLELVDDFVVWHDSQKNIDK